MTFTRRSLLVSLVATLGLRSSLSAQEHHHADYGVAARGYKSRRFKVEPQPERIPTTLPALFYRRDGSLMVAQPPHALSGNARAKWLNDPDLGGFSWDLTTSRYFKRESAAAKDAILIGEWESFADWGWWATSLMGATIHYNTDVVELTLPWAWVYREVS